MSNDLTGFRTSYSGEGNYSIFYNDKIVVAVGTHEGRTDVRGDVPLSNGIASFLNSPIYEWLCENINNLERFKDGTTR